VGQTSGILWALQIIVGPIILGLALLYAIFHYRRRGRLQGESNSSGRDIVVYGLPVVIAILLFAFLMLIPGSQ
jgi:heme/copper-type cytochrome/quinol oxidase subunit 2